MAPENRANMQAEVQKMQQRCILGRCLSHLVDPILQFLYTQRHRCGRIYDGRMTVVFQHVTICTFRVLGRLYIQLNLFNPRIFPHTVFVGLNLSPLVHSSITIIYNKTMYVGSYEECWPVVTWCLKMFFHPFPSSLTAPKTRQDILCIFFLGGHPVIWEIITLDSAVTIPLNTFRHTFRTPRLTLATCMFNTIRRLPIE